jgi:hypothetical protein
MILLLLEHLKKWPIECCLFSFLIISSLSLKILAFKINSIS